MDLFSGKVRTLNEEEMIEHAVEELRKMIERIVVR